MILQLAADQVIYMSEDGPSETVETLRGATKTNFTCLPSQPTEFAARTGAHLRAMSTMSYFHSKTGHIGHDAWFDAPLSSIKPWEVAYTGPSKGIFGLLSYDYQAPPNLLAEAINGMVLALVEVEDAKAYRQLAEFGSTQPSLLQTPEGIPYIPNPDDVTLDPRFCRSIGFVLIRGIGKRALQILTPLSSKTFEESKQNGRDLVLLYGKLDTPDWAYKEDLYYGSSGEGDDEDLETSEMDVKPDATAEVAGSREIRSGQEPSSLEVPWVEVLKGNEKRPLGSKVWRVRRDLGKNNDA